jgi:hypothetical protein
MDGFGAAGTGCLLAALAGVALASGAQLGTPAPAETEPPAAASPGAPAAASRGAPAAQPAPVRVLGRTDRSSVPIGTPFRYTVEVRGPRSVELLVPILEGQLGELTVVDFGEEPVREEGGETVVTRWYSLLAYRPGYLLIPGLTVQYRDAGGTLGRADGEDIGIVVASLLEGVPETADIRDIKPPVAVPFDWTPVLLGAGALAVLGIVVGGVVWWVRRWNAPAPVVARPADLDALEALARLRHARLDDAAALAAWYVALSGIVRTYIERRFGIRAPEMTTEEFMVAVQRDARLLPSHRELLAGFLAGCDLVKFARHVPDAGASEGAYEAARRFVTETRPVAEEAARAA